MPIAFIFLQPGKCMVSSMLLFSLLTGKLLSSAPTSYLSLASSLKEKRNMRWTTSMSTKDLLANANTWFHGRVTLALRTLENLDHIWKMLVSFFKHTS